MVNTKGLREGNEAKKPVFKFKEGEKVLCFHGPLIYEAKILSTRVEEKYAQYLIHYAGWNKSWDEWVPELRVLKYNEVNLQKQKALHKSNQLEPKGKGKKRVICDLNKLSDKNENRSSTPKVGSAWSGSGNSSSPESASDSPKKRKSKNDPSVESEAQFSSKLEVKIKVPDELKPLLVDDWENIMASRLLKLPARITVEKVLEDYSKNSYSVRSSTSAQRLLYRPELVQGIRDYFNAMLGSQLLYEVERKQFNEIMKEQPPNTSPSAVFGTVHLLRFFVKLGQTLVYTRLDEKGIQLLVTHINDFLRFMVKNSSDYFNVQDYTQDKSEALKN